MVENTEPVGELVCPAGTPASLRTAVDAGADAVYCGFQNATNARNFPGLNFTLPEMEKAVVYAHERGTKVLLAAHKAGCRFDAWDDKLNIAAWRTAFKSAGLDLDGYAAREIKQDEFLPWSVIDTGVKTEFLAKEYAAAREGKISPICAPGRCRQCGVC